MSFGNKIYDPEKPLISIHIPKAGGTSFRSVLQHWFGDKLFFHYFDEPKNKMPEKHELLPMSCIHGHFNSSRSFGIMHYYPIVDQFITILRDPFEILVSRYYFQKKRDKAGVLFRDGKPLKLADDVNAFLENEIYNPDYAPNILNFFPVPLTRSNYKKVIEKYFIFIIFIDQFQSGIDKLAKLLNFSPVKVSFENVSERFGQVDPSFRKKFMDSHELEYEVYNYARKIFINE